MRDRRDKREVPADRVDRSRGGPRSGASALSRLRDPQAALLGVLLIHLPVLVLVGLARGTSPVRAAAEVGPAAVLALLAARPGPARSRAVLCATGLAYSSVALVDLTGGAPAGYLHIFVVLALLAAYRDPFPLAAAALVTVAGHLAALVGGSRLSYDHGTATRGAGWAAAHALAVLLAAAVIGLRQAAVPAAPVEAGPSADAEPADDDAGPALPAHELVVSLARRNQALLQRQLAKIDELEAREENATALADLFALDHLATRMRRNAESLLVLSGEDTPRRWSRAVALSDVLRGAVAEIEDYTRVDVSVEQDAELVGRAVTDLVHLLAELVENATVFSPPASRVRLHGERDAAGYRVTVSDEGVGIAPEELAGHAARLRAGDATELTSPGMLGYQVVARLAARLGIQVALDSEPGRGTVVSVVLPAVLLAEEPDAIAPAEAGWPQPATDSLQPATDSLQAAAPAPGWPQPAPAPAGEPGWPVPQPGESWQPAQQPEPVWQAPEEPEPVWQAPQQPEPAWAERATGPAAAEPAGGPAAAMTEDLPAVLSPAAELARDRAADPILALGVPREYMPEDWPSPVPTAADWGQYLPPAEPAAQPDAAGYGGRQQGDPGTAESYGAPSQVPVPETEPYGGAFQAAPMDHPAGPAGEEAEPPADAPYAYPSYAEAAEAGPEPAPGPEMPEARHPVSLPPSVSEEPPPPLAVTVAPEAGWPADVPLLAPDPGSPPAGEPVPQFAPAASYQPPAAPPVEPVPQFAPAAPYQPPAAPPVEPVPQFAPAAPYQPPAPAWETAGVAPAGGDGGGWPVQPAGDVGGTTAAGLVRRVPQASLNPQINAPAPASAAPGPALSGPAPERARALLATYQDGLARGRAALAEHGGDDNQDGEPA